MSVLAERFQKLLTDRYVIERELGRGGMAVVFLARDVRHDRPVAIKVFRSDIGDAPGAERLQREHQLSIDEAVRLAVEVADALDFAHVREVIHRDIKPENILLHDGHAIVADFGIARAMRRSGSEWTTAAGMTVGSPAYMSPEQASGDHEIDGRADIYSLACVLFETLAAEPPFTSRAAHMIIAAKLSSAPRHVRELRPDVPAPLDAAIAKALARNPNDRFASARAFGAALAASLQSSIAI